MATSLLFFEHAIAQPPLLISLEEAFSTATLLGRDNRWAWNITVPLYKAWDNDGVPSGGCFVDGVENCTTICSRQESIFLDPTTIHNCAVFWRLQYLGLFSHNIAGNGLDLSTGMSLLTESPVVQPSDQWWDNTDPISHCLQRTCSASDKSKSRNCDDHHIPVFEGESCVSPTKPFPLWYNICGGDGDDRIVDYNLNVDVGGIGVRYAMAHRSE